MFLLDVVPLALTNYFYQDLRVLDFSYVLNQQRHVQILMHNVWQVLHILLSH
jgi:hypothetical protein